MVRPGARHATLRSRARLSGPWSPTAQRCADADRCDARADGSKDRGMAADGRQVERLELTAVGLCAARSTAQKVYVPELPAPDQFPS